METENILLVAVFAIGLISGVAVSFAITTNQWQQEIVNKGFAEWHIASGTREVEFKWKEKQ